MKEPTDYCRFFLFLGGFRVIVVLEMILKMENSAFLSSLLAYAEILRVKNGLKHISAGLIVAAASSYASFEYSGKVTTKIPEKFEPERLRLAVSMLSPHKLTLMPFICVKLRNPRNELDTPFSFQSSIRVARRRGRVLLSSDIVFFEAAAEFLPHLLSSMRNNPLFKDGVDTYALTRDIDNQILSYTDELLSETPMPSLERLHEIKQLSSLPPIVKIMEPSVMNDEFKKVIRISLEQRVLTLSIPDFFDTDAPLTLHIHRVNRTYVVHDNGSAVRYLRKCYKKADDVINKVCEPSVFDGDNFVGAFNSTKTFLSYIQRVVLLGHAYLYHNSIDKPFLRFFLEYSELKHRRDPLEDHLVQMLSDAVSFEFFETTGHVARLRTTSTMCDVPWAFVLEARGDELLLRDLNRGALKGEILEMLYYHHNIAGLDYELIAPYFQRFGCELRDGEIVLSGKAGDWRTLLLRYFNMAVLVSSLAELIKSPF